MHRSQLLERLTLAPAAGQGEPQQPARVVRPYRRALARTSARGPVASSSSAAVSVQRLAGQHRCFCRVASGQLGAGALEQTAQQQHVDVLVPEPEPVAVAVPDQHVRAALRPHAGDQHLQCLGGVGRPVVGPHHVDQAPRRRRPPVPASSAASRAAGRSPGSGAPRQLTSSRRRRAGVTPASLRRESISHVSRPDIPDGAGRQPCRLAGIALPARAQFPRTSGETASPTPAPADAQRRTPRAGCRR